MNRVAKILRTYPCAYCNARPGEPCRYSWRRLSGSHNARWRAAVRDGALRLDEEPHTDEA